MRHWIEIHCSASLEWQDRFDPKDKDPHSFAITKHIHPLAQQTLLHPFNQIPYVGWRTLRCGGGKGDCVFGNGVEEEMQAAAVRIKRAGQL